MIIDFPSAPQEISAKECPFRNRSHPKTIEKHSGVTKIIEVTDLQIILITFEKTTTTTTTTTKTTS